MALPKKPAHAIFPIVRQHRRRIRGRLGTAFFLHLDGTFMTARHVLDVATELPDESIAALMSDGSMREISNIRLSSELDIAIGSVRPPTFCVPLAFVGRDPAGNADLITFEYSNVAGQRVVPSTRRGYCVSIHSYRSFKHASREARFLELSFTAPVGASGAPILVEKDGTIAGMIVDHADRDLGEYRTAMAMAISSRHLRDFAYEKGLGKKLLVTATLGAILKAASDKLTETAIQGAKANGILHSARVVSVVPRREQSALVPGEMEDDPHTLTCTVNVRVKVQGWGGPVPMNHESWMGSTNLDLEIAVVGYVDSWPGHYGDLRISDTECRLLTS